jgi:hypothetical protein
MLEYETSEALRRGLPRDIAISPKNAEERLAAMSPEELRAAAIEEAAAITKSASLKSAGEDLSKWLAFHPEYVDSIENARAMAGFHAARGTRLPSLADHEAAYNALRDAGQLNVDQSVLEAQRKLKDQEWAAQTKAQGGIGAQPSEEDMYSMSMDELRRQAQAHGF